MVDIGNTQWFGRIVEAEMEKADIPIKKRPACREYVRKHHYICKVPGNCPLMNCSFIDISVNVWKSKYEKRAKKNGKIHRSYYVRDNI